MISIKRLVGGYVLALVAMAAMSVDTSADERENLFGDDLPNAVPAVSQSEKGGGSGIKGFVQFELARTTAVPEHWSKMRTRGELAGTGSLGDGINWKLSARADYDAVYARNDFYPAEVERNQRANFYLRENYIDIGRGDWDFRLGRQHVVWGEMVGLFFADVVSARDLREFILPEFEAMRVPQWAARAEYFKDDVHAEFLWIPVASYDMIGKPGSDFFPCQPLAPCTSAYYRQEQRPANNLRHGNYGVRISALKNGWDFSGFYYNSMDISPAFYREFVGPAVVYEARHNRINQVGGTIAKDLGTIVIKAEAVYTDGRRFGVLRASDADGVVSQDTVDWALGMDFLPGEDSRFNVQFFQRAFLNHDPDIIPNRRESGYSLYWSSKLGRKLEGQITFISSLNRPDWLFRPRLAWNYEKNWRLLVGADIFNGPPTGFFGQYDSRDRVYTEVRYSF